MCGTHYRSVDERTHVHSPICSIAIPVPMDGVALSEVHHDTANGMYPCSAPHISEHCPYIVPGMLYTIAVVLALPGTQS